MSGKRSQESRRIKSSLGVARDEKKKNKLLAKYGRRERNRVMDRMRKIIARLVRIAEKFRADLVREDLRDLKSGRRTRSRQLNHRLSTLPYRYVACLNNVPPPR